MKKLISAALAAVALAGFANVQSEQAELVRRQARSVHLYYATTNDFTAAQASVTVTESRKDTYFSILGWQHGYCGIQDWGDARVFIFSVWDPSDPEDHSARPENMPEEKRARILYSHPLVNVSRFGGEGSGAKTLTGLEWKEGEAVTVKVETAPDGKDRIAFTCFVKTGADCEWTKIATISTIRDPNVKNGLGYIASFVEDFRRDYQSAKESRRAEFSDVMVRLPGSGEWVKVDKAMFSADSNPATNIDAGKVAPGRWYLRTGGDTPDNHEKLWHWMG